MQYVRSKEKKKEGEEAEKKEEEIKTEHIEFQKENELIQKERRKTNYVHMLDSFARVLTNYHHTNKRIFSD